MTSNETGTFTLAAAPMPPVVEPFTWTAPSGAVVCLPPIRDTRAGVWRRLRGQPEEDQIFGLLEAVCDEQTMAALDDLTMAELGELFAAWVQTSTGATLPESSGSSS